MLKVASIDYLDTVNTDGIAMTVYFQGCHFHCEGCHNKELQAFDGGTAYSFLELYDLIKKQFDTGGYDYLCLLGGEPLDQPHDFLRVLLEKLVADNINVYLYTGFDYEHVPSWAKRLCYCIKAGSYNISFAKEGKLATGNQAYYYKSGRIVK